MQTLNVLSPEKELQITLNHMAKKHHSLDYVRNVYDESFVVDYEYNEHDIEKTATFKSVYKKYAIDVTKLSMITFINDNLKDHLRISLDTPYTVYPAIYRDFRDFMSKKTSFMSDLEFLNTLKNVKSDILRETFVYFLDLVKDDLLASGASFYTLVYLKKMDSLYNYGGEKDRLYIYYRDICLSSINKVEKKLIRDLENEPIQLRSKHIKRLGN